MDVDTNEVFRVCMMPDKASKQKRRELNRFSRERDWQKLPPIHGYWSRRYLAPKLEEVYGTRGTVPFFVDGLLAGRPPSKRLDFVSLGSGLCRVEQDVAAQLKARGFHDFRIECLEMSSERCAAANARFVAEGLSEHICVRQQDLSNWNPDRSYSSVMANHSLHHFTELEGIFASVVEVMDDSGNFVINDIVGRNGHQRWPEVLRYLEPIWDTLPPKYKFNNRRDRVDEDYDNWDYSLRSNEGVRAQDILPLLNNFFDASHLVATGGLIDDFIDRTYGHNFDVESAEDTCLIDQISFMNEALIEAGMIKPTMLMAWYRKKSSSPPETRIHRGWSQEFCTRDPDQAEISVTRPLRSDAWSRRLKQVLRRIKARWL